MQVLHRYKKLLFTKLNIMYTFLYAIENKYCFIFLLIFNCIQSQKYMCLYTVLISRCIQMNQRQSLLVGKYVSYS